MEGSRYIVHQRSYGEDLGLKVISRDYKYTNLGIFYSKNIEMTLEQI